MTRYVLLLVLWTLLTGCFAPGTYDGHSYDEMRPPRPNPVQPDRR
jgi:hypothetical protein